MCLFPLYFQKARFSPLLYCQSQELPNGSVKEAPAPIPAPLEATGSDTTVDADADVDAGDHKPKLCRLIKEEDSYGFHLNAIRGQPGSFVKEVWEPVPAAQQTQPVRMGCSVQGTSRHDTNSGHTSRLRECSLSSAAVVAWCLYPVGKGSETTLQPPMPSAQQRLSVVLGQYSLAQWSSGGAAHQGEEMWLRSVEALQEGSCPAQPLPCLELTLRTSVHRFSRVAPLTRPGWRMRTLSLK